MINQRDGILKLSRFILAGSHSNSSVLFLLTVTARDRAKSLGTHPAPTWSSQGTVRSMPLLGLDTG